MRSTMSVASRQRPRHLTSSASIFFRRFFARPYSTPNTVTPIAAATDTAMTSAVLQSMPALYRVRFLRTGFLTLSFVFSGSKSHALPAAMPSITPAIAADNQSAPATL